MNRSAAMKAVWARKRRLNIHKFGPRKGHSCKYGKAPSGYCSKKPTKKAMKAATRIQAFIRKRQEKRRAENYRKYAAARGF